jgi:DNA-binding transcriptional LysR family regulator
MIRAGVVLVDIRTFLALADELHFGLASERLGIAPSYVEQTNRTLETRIGGSLFDRTSRRVRLTPLGLELGSRLRPVYTQLLAAPDATSTSVRETRGVLRVGVAMFDRERLIAGARS